MARRTLRRGAVSIMVATVALLLLPLTPALSAQQTATQPAAEAATFFIAGYVTTPGSYPWSEGMTVARGVALAGGYDSEGSKNELQVQRVIDGKLTSFEVTEEDLVQPADVIMVRARRVGR